MRPFAALGLLAMLAATPVMAQDAGQIARVRGGASCARCNLFQADLSNLTLKGLNLSGSRLRQADFSLAVMNRTSFAGTDLRDVNAYGGVFSSASFAGANMTNSTWVGAYLEGANFRRATLAGANFSGAEMAHATGLTQAQLNGACGDEATLLPAGLRIPACR